jgi:excinuclease ABC subunit A
MTTPTIHIRGARTHNLRNIDVDIPVGKMTVITGLSGSGKSSLAYDTMFAEGQRRYLESVSVQTHQMIRSLRRPDVDEVSGLPPTVSVDQRVGRVPARSTVAVTTDIYDYLRLLYARSGVVHCTTCDRPVQSQTTEEIVQRVLQFPERSKFMLLAPLIRKRRGSHREVLERVARHGLVRIRVNGELIDLADADELDESKPHTIDAVVDRLILKEGVEQRLQESVALAVRESGDACIVSVQVDGNWHDHYFNTRHSCGSCEVSFPEPDPGLFSFNSGRGACPDCEGLGVEGVADDSADITVFRQRPCTTCDGGRLQKLPSAIRFGQLTLPQFTALSVADALETVRRWQQELELPADGRSDNFTIRPEGHAAALRILPDLQRQLASLVRVGLDYLSLNRSTRSLSGGEYQRSRLACCLGSDVHGACYILDEPTNGLHPKDTQLLLDILCDIRDSGATLVLVEHDPEVMRAADHLIDIGPGAGTDGGCVLYAGAPLAIPNDTATGSVVSEQSPATVPKASVEIDIATDQALTIRNATIHNLQNVSVSVPLNRFVCVTGVSGSGKSSLINGTLFPVVSAACNPQAHIEATLADVECQSIDGLEHINRVVLVDGRSVSRNRRSCLATYSGVWNDIRKLYARTREARARGIGAPQFSFNSGSGRCSQCKGTGIQDIRMNLLPDAEVPCSSCHGQRFNSEILKIRFAGRSVHDVLDLRVDGALEAFSEIESTVRRLRPFQQVGLGYMTLGQSASTFSGGEAQRIRLATELLETPDSKTLYLLDEPTRGLHAADVDRLLEVLRGFVERNHSVIVIEHSTQVMRASDWIIDMGPAAADKGGQIIAEGTPDTLRGHPESITGRWM